MPAFTTIENMYADGIANIIGPQLAGGIFILFFFGIIFLKGLPGMAKIAIGVPVLFIGFSIMGIADFNVLLVIGLGMLFTYALWRVFSR